MSLTAPGPDRNASDPKVRGGQINRDAPSQHPVLIRMPLTAPALSQRGVITLGTRSGVSGGYPPPPPLTLHSPPPSGPASVYSPVPADASAPASSIALNKPPFDPFRTRGRAPSLLPLSLLRCECPAVSLYSALLPRPCPSVWGERAIPIPRSAVEVLLLLLALWQGPCTQC